MSDVERLSEELELAKLAEKLEAARDLMHENRTPSRIAAYQKASDALATARTALRVKYGPDEPGPGDASPRPETIRVKGRGPA